MGDKTLIFLMVLFVAAGVYGFDQYAVQNGGVSPVGQMIDLAGISRGQNLRGKDPDDVEVIIEHRTFQFHSQQSLERLQQKYQQIEAQRMTLVENRRDILEKLMDIVSDTEAEAVQYAKRINTEKERFLKQVPKLEEFRQKIMVIQQQSDPALRQEEYQNLKNELLSFLAEGIEQPEKNLPRLTQVLESLEKVLEGTDSERIIIEDCSEVESCVQQHIGEIETGVYGMARQTGDDVKELLTLMEQLREEYQEQIYDSYNQEMMIEESQDKVDSQLKYMVEQLVKVTENDLKDLIYLYQELEMERRMLTDYVTAQQEDWRRRNKESARLVKEKIKGLKKTFQVDFRRLQEKNQNLERNQEELVQDAQGKFYEMKRVMEQRHMANRGFVSEIAGMVNIDIQRLVEDQGYAMKKNKSYMSERKGMAKPLINYASRGINQKDMGGLTTEIKSNLSQPIELRKTDPLRQLNR